MAALLSNAVKDQIKHANDIVDVVSSYLGPLKKAGTNWKTLCPFHKEKSPSFNVNPVKQIFHCFGCQKGGDVFEFVKDYENVTFMEAVQRLAERVHIPLEFENDPQAGQRRHVKDTLLKIHEQIARRWHDVLLNDAQGQIARDYLEKRGFDETAIKLFRLGYAPNEWDDTVNWATSKGHDLGTVENGGLIIKRDSSEGYYDRFRGRLMFPICDAQGQVIGFSGRILTGDENTAKYINSPETPLFFKSKVLYGLHRSRRALAERGHALVCEGQLDLIRCYTSGIENVVAPQGTALTADHGQILKRYTDEAVLCFDSDTAGKNAAIRSMESLASSGLAVRVLTIPAPHDPDSFVREAGAEAFGQLIEKAPEFFEFYLNQLCQSNDPKSDKGRKAIVREMREMLHKTADAVAEDIWTRKTANRLGVSETALRAEFGKRKPVWQPVPDDGPPTDDELDSAPTPTSDKDKDLLRLFFAADWTMLDAGEWLTPDLLDNPVVREIIQTHAAALTRDEWDGESPLLDRLENPHARNLLTEILSTQRKQENVEARLSNALARLQSQFPDRKLAQLIARINQPGATAEEKLALMAECNELQKQKAARVKNSPTHAR